MVTEYDIVTVPPADAVEDAPFPPAEAMLVLRSHRFVWVELRTPAPVQTASMTMFPDVVPVTAALGVVPLPNAVTAVPRGLVWLTPVNDTDPAEIASILLLVVTTTVFAPVAGAISRNNST